MKSELNSKVVVFGGTGGSGSKLCQDLRETGARLVIAGRDQGKLDELARELDAKGSSSTPRTPRRSTTASTSWCASAAKSTGWSTASAQSS